MLSFVRQNKVTFIMYCLLCEKFILLFGHFIYINSESWPVVGFCPHVGSTGGVRDKLEHSLPQFWVLEGGVQCNELGNRTIRLYHPHLAIGV